MSEAAAGRRGFSRPDVRRDLCPRHGLRYRACSRLCVASRVHCVTNPGRPPGLHGSQVPASLFPFTPLGFALSGGAYAALRRLRTPNWIWSGSSRAMRRSGRARSRSCCVIPSALFIAWRLRHAASRAKRCASKRSLRTTRVSDCRLCALSRCSAALGVRRAPWRTSSSCARRTASWWSTSRCPSAASTKASGVACSSRDPFGLAPHRAALVRAARSVGVAALGRSVATAGAHRVGGR